MSDETVDQFVLKPRQRAVSCDFGVLEDDYIRDQVIDECYSSHLRAKVLFLLVKPIVCLFVCFFYFSLPSRHRISKSLLSPNTCPVRSPRFCVQGKVSSSTFLTRKEGTTDESEKHFGCYQLEHFNLYRESSVSDRSLGIVNSIYEGVIDGSLNTCLGSSLFFFFEKASLKYLLTRFRVLLFG